MKSQYLFALLILICSCQTQGKSYAKKYCNQEISLLKAESQHKVIYDFSLMPDKQIEHLSSQVDISLCNGLAKLNASFEAKDFHIETLLISNWFCNDSSYLKVNLPSCYLLRSKTILLNQYGKVLIDGYPCEMDSISIRVSDLSKTFFWDNDFEQVVFKIIWDQNSSEDQRKEVFERTVIGYLHAANEISKDLFELDLCQLDSSKVQELKDQFQFAIAMKKDLPMPPPPAIMDGIEADSIEIELEIDYK